MGALYSIGHSTKSITEFIDELKLYNINLVVDVRSIPRSRHNPQYEKEKLKNYLQKYSIKYKHLKQLGGLRPKAKITQNEGWHNQSFRNYADYMLTNQFMLGLNKLLNYSTHQNTAIMCAEVLPWRCHRSLIADMLILKNIKIIHIISKNNTIQHKLTSFANPLSDKIYYLKQK